MTKKERWIAACVATVMGAIPLLLYLPTTPRVEHSIAIVCEPGWILAYILVGGVHAGNMDLHPALAALITVLFWVGVVVLYFRIVGRRRREAEQKALDTRRGDVRARSGNS